MGNYLQVYLLGVLASLAVYVVFIYNWRGLIFQSIEQKTFPWRIHIPIFIGVIAFSWLGVFTQAIIYDGEGTKI